MNAGLLAIVQRVGAGAEAGAGRTVAGAGSTEGAKEGVGAAAAAAPSPSPPPASAASADAFVGRPVEKLFDGVWYCGTVRRRCSAAEEGGGAPMWHVVYEVRGWALG